MSAAELGQGEFLAALQALLPQGIAWPRDADTVQTAFLASIAARQAALHARIGDLSERESFPSTSAELLIDWERAFGLPDVCGPVPDFLAARRSALIFKITQRTSPTPATFVAMAEAFGAAVTITEFQPHTCEDDCERPVYDEAWAYAFAVNGPARVIYEQTCEDNCQAPLRDWQTGPYECAIRRAAPAHTVPIFTYGA